MRLFYHAVPVEMLEEKIKIEKEIDNIIVDFNNRAELKHFQNREEYDKTLSERKWLYSVKILKDGWNILFKEAVIPINGANDNEQWSAPFKIINNVLFHADWYYQQKSYNIPTSLIPQGIFEGSIDEINQYW